MLFHQTLMRFSRSTHLLICESMESLTSIIKTGKPIMVKIIDLVNSVKNFLFQITLLRWLTFLFRSLAGTLTILLFWIYLFLLMLLFILQ